MSGEPVILSEWSRNARETIRVSLSCDQGRPTIEIREWYSASQGLKRGRKGITLTVAKLRKLATAINMAVKVAESKGWIKQEETGR